jgi:predicted enzyme involved in methoxymalonyl-ACP biosynthesis
LQSVFVDASQEVYDAYSAQIDNAEKVYDNKKDDTNFVFSDIKASLETTYASADPYFEDQTRLVFKSLSSLAKIFNII